ncbi:hypothetical protein TRICI_006593 [Trichomonascus ciferrii]|uniref:Eukaryotic translation initiation factor 2A n=1 Tax=Trichomonascus ciferrii TaxID=44093 RepID=A0A642UG49_9ASCO|nr:hypothetical protein TRICI_006593 [Trichomonascus ciferrii]
MVEETQYFSRLPKTVAINKGAPGYDAVEGFNGPQETVVRTAVYSPDGKYFAYSIPKEVHIVKPESGEVVTKLTTEYDVVEIAFSPLGTFVLTWERPKKNAETGNFDPNLRVWDSATGELVESFVQKNQGNWSIQYTYDEKYCARLVTTGLLQFYESRNLRSPYAKLKLDGATEFSLSPGQNYSVAVFVPELQGKPAAVKVYQIPNFNQAVSQKTFFKADKIQMKWNKIGTALLVLASTDVDHSGKSYYGETNLYLLGIAGSYDSRVALDKEGTIHGFAWSSNSREFGVVYGYMPAKTTIFDARGNEVHSFPVAARNTILFSPHGRFVVLAGFGNLQGTMDVYDRQKQFAKVSTIEAPNTSVCEWSPDGRYILTATTSPRLRVDNGVKIWHYTGKLMYVKEHEELFAVGWRPVDAAKFPIKATPSPAPEAHASAAAAKTKQPAAKAGAYRPPHARMAGVTAAPTSLHERTAANATPSAQKYVPGASRQVPGAGGRQVPGAPKPGAAANNNNSNNKPRRKKKTENTDAASSEQKPNNDAADTAAPPETNSTGAPTGSSPEDKKIRSLLKKLRAIEDLKQRQAVGDKLEDTQVQKITTEPKIRQELATLGWKE